MSHTGRLNTSQEVLSIWKYVRKYISKKKILFSLEIVIKAGGGIYYVCFVFIVFCASLHKRAPLDKPSKMILIDIICNFLHSNFTQNNKITNMNTPIFALCQLQTKKGQGLNWRLMGNLMKRYIWVQMSSHPIHPLIKSLKCGYKDFQF